MLRNAILMLSRHVCLLHAPPLSQCPTWAHPIVVKVWTHPSSPDLTIRPNVLEHLQNCCLRNERINHLWVRLIEQILGNSKTACVLSCLLTLTNFCYIKQLQFRLVRYWYIVWLGVSEDDVFTRCRWWCVMSSVAVEINIMRWSCDWCVHPHTHIVPQKTQHVKEFAILILFCFFPFGRTTHNRWDKAAWYTGWRDKVDLTGHDMMFGN